MKTHRQLLTNKAARQYLRDVRGITISRQSLYNYIAEHRTECESVGGDEKTRPALWLIPKRLLDKYTPDSARKNAGHARAEQAVKPVTPQVIPATMPALNQIASHKAAVPPIHNPADPLNMYVHTGSK